MSTERKGKGEGRLGLGRHCKWVTVDKRARQQGRAMFGTSVVCVGTSGLVDLFRFGLLLLDEITVFSVGVSFISVTVSIFGLAFVLSFPCALLFAVLVAFFLPFF